MNGKILFVDDEVRVLQAMQRTLRRDFDVAVADSGSKALALLEQQAFAVIVSDMRMPEMNGLQLLTRVRDRWPLVTRMMLTGNSDQDTAIQAVNCGEVFRFMNKPCDPEVLRSALRAGIRQHELVTAEKSLLEDTLRGSLLAMSEILAVTKPEIFGATSRIRARAAQLCTALGVDSAWQVDTAAMLCKLGCVNLDADVCRRAIEGGELSKDEQKSFDAHPSLGAELISRVPRMDAVADIVRLQHKNYDGSGTPIAETASGDALPVGARILKVTIELDRLCAAGWSEPAALAELRKSRGRFDPAVLAALGEVVEASGKSVTRRIGVDGLVDGMVIGEDVTTDEGALLVCAGQPVTPVIRQRLQRFAAAGRLAGQLLVAEAAAANDAAA